MPNWSTATQAERRTAAFMALPASLGRIPAKLCGISPRAPTHAFRFFQLGPPYQMSPTVYPSGNGSVGSSTYVAIPVIQACPEMLGTTAV